MRSARNAILIVCEGQETERRYFTALVRDRRLTEVHIEDSSACGSNPLSLVDHAKKINDGTQDAVWARIGAAR